jgi:DNA polymerase-3 subunit alpha
VTIEDMEGAVEVMFFGETYLAYSTVLAEDAVVVIRGRVRRRDETMQLQAMEVSLPDVSVTADSPVVVSLAVARCTPPLVERLREVLSTHPGVTEVHLRLTQPGRATVMRLDDGLRVERSPSLFGDLKALLGPSCLAS